MLTKLHMTFRLRSHFMRYFATIPVPKQTQKLSDLAVLRNAIETKSTMGALSAFNRIVIHENEMARSRLRNTITGHKVEERIGLILKHRLSEKDLVGLLKLIVNLRTSSPRELRKIKTSLRYIDTIYNVLGYPCSLEYLQAKAQVLRRLLRRKELNEVYDTIEEKYQMDLTNQRTADKVVFMCHDESIPLSEAKRHFEMLCAAVKENEKKLLITPLKELLRATSLRGEYEDVPDLWSLTGKFGIPRSESLYKELAYCHARKGNSKMNLYKGRLAPVLKTLTREGLEMSLEERKKIIFTCYLSAKKYQNVLRDFQRMEGEKQSISADLVGLVLQATFNDRPTPKAMLRIYFRMIKKGIEPRYESLFWICEVLSRDKDLTSDRIKELCLKSGGKMTFDFCLHILQGLVQCCHDALNEVLPSEEVEDDEPRIIREISPESRKRLVRYSQLAQMMFESIKKDFAVVDKTKVRTAFAVHLEILRCCGEISSDQIISLLVLAIENEVISRGLFDRGMKHARLVGSSEAAEKIFEMARKSNKGPSLRMYNHILWILMEKYPLTNGLPVHTSIIKYLREFKIDLEYFGLERISGSHAVVWIAKKLSGESGAAPLSPLEPGFFAFLDSSIVAHP